MSNEICPIMKNFLVSKASAFLAPEEIAELSETELDILLETHINLMPLVPSERITPFHLQMAIHQDRASAIPTELWTQSLVMDALKAGCSGYVWIPSEFLNLRTLIFIATYKPNVIYQMLCDDIKVGNAVRLMAIQTAREKGFFQLLSDLIQASSTSE